MRVLLVTIALLFAQAPPQQSGKAGIEGLVVNTTTGDPVEGVRIVLTRDNSTEANPGGTVPRNPVNDSVRVTGYSASAGLFSLNTSVPILPAPAAPPESTDIRGRFALKELEPGMYRLTFSKNGFVRQEYGQRILSGQGTPFRLTAGQTLQDLTMRLTPTATISGRTVNEASQPMANVVIELLRNSYNANGQRTLQSVSTTRTNDRGEYRFPFITPGRYIVGAGTQPGATNSIFGGLAWVSPNEFEEASAHAYYPGVSDSSASTTIDVPAGTDLGGIDFRLGRQQVFRLRGRVVDASGKPPASVFLGIFYVVNGSSGGGSFGAENYKEADGTFEFRNVVPGSYGIVEGGGASTVVNGRRITSRPGMVVSVAVGNADVDGIVLTVPTGAAISGRLAADGRSLASVPGVEKLQVQLRTADGLAGPYTTPNPSPLDKDGGFKLDNVGPGEYRVAVVGIPPDYFIKEARFGGADVLNQKMQFDSSQNAQLDIVISPNTAQLSGVVTDDKQQPVPGVQAVLIPDRARDRTELYKTVSTDESGRFTMTGIPPGDYKIFAWEAIEQYAWFDPEIVLRFESRAKAVHLSDLSNETIEFRSISNTK
jgi:5-hydroxyisourate hydrolase-like protein (transthyretin family)